MLGEKPLCIGEDVTFTCTVIGAGRLKWVIGSVNNVIVFGLEENSVSLNNSRQDSSGNFAALLTSYSRSESSSFLGNLTSTLHVHVDAEMYLPGVIGCENGLTDVSTLKLSIAGVYTTLKITVEFVVYTLHACHNSIPTVIMSVYCSDARACMYYSDYYNW